MSAKQYLGAKDQANLWNTKKKRKNRKRKRKSKIKKKKKRKQKGEKTQFYHLNLSVSHIPSFSVPAGLLWIPWKPRENVVSLRLANEVLLTGECYS